MSTHSRASLAQLDLNAATRLAAAADVIRTEARAMNLIVTGLIKNGAWKGPDAFGFGLRWEREIGELSRTGANLRACADNLHADAQLRLRELAMVPYLPPADLDT
jgi:hypothetical protein